MLSLGIGALNLRFKLALLILYHLLAPLSLHVSLFSNALKVLLALSILFINHLLHSFVGHGVVVAVSRLPLVLLFEILSNCQLVSKGAKVRLNH